MADLPGVRVSNMPSDASLDGTELVYIINNGVSSKCTIQQIWNGVLGAITDLDDAVDLARRWASEDVNVPVETDPVNLYSALHYAYQSDLSAQAAISASGDAQAYRNQALNFRNQAEGFRDEAEGFRDETQEARDDLLDENGDIIVSANLILSGTQAEIEAKNAGDTPMEVGEPAYVTDLKQVWFRDGDGNITVFRDEGQAIVFVGNTVFVDQAIGDDSTGERGNFARSFATFQAAVAAAQEFDRIQVRPGRYLATSTITIAQAYLSIHFESGAALVMIYPGSSTERTLLRWETSTVAHADFRGTGYLYITADDGGRWIDYLAPYPELLDGGVVLGVSPRENNPAPMANKILEIYGEYPPGLDGSFPVCNIHVGNRGLCGEVRTNFPNCATQCDVDIVCGDWDYANISTYFHGDPDGSGDWFSTRNTPSQYRVRSSGTIHIAPHDGIRSGGWTEVFVRATHLDISGWLGVFSSPSKVVGGRDIMEGATPLDIKVESSSSSFGYIETGGIEWQIFTPQGIGDVSDLTIRISLGRCEVNFETLQFLGIWATGAGATNEYKVLIYDTQFNGNADTLNNFSTPGYGDGFIGVTNPDNMVVRLENVTSPVELLPSDPVSILTGSYQVVDQII